MENVKKLASTGDKKRINSAVYVIQRILIVFVTLTMFFPSFNPSRISLKINKNTSLFTAGVSYDTLTENLQRAFKQGWVAEYVFGILLAASLIVIIGILLCVLGTCMSLGNNKMRRAGIKFPVIGSLVMLAGVGGIVASYMMVSASERADKIEPDFPMGIIFYAAAAVIILILSLTATRVERGAEIEENMRMEEGYMLFLMLMPIVFASFIFSYLPLYGWRYAFFDYTAGATLGADNFVGFKWFTHLFQNPATRNDIVRVMRNTFAMSGLGLITSWFPMAFAVLLTEIGSARYRKFVQIFTTIPNFISWVLVYAIALAIFSTDGFVNSMLREVGVDASTNYLMSADYTWVKMFLWGTWKGIGWSAIIYIAAISGIDQGLYEAAMIDGAGRFRRIWSITIPSLMPTYFVLLLMQIAGMLSNGLEQYLVFKNANNIDVIEVLDLYVYNLGFDGGQIPLSTVVSMSKSIISVTLLFIANKVSKSVRGESII